MKTLKVHETKRQSSRGAFRNGCSAKRNSRSISTLTVKNFKETCKEADFKEIWRRTAGNVAKISAPLQILLKVFDHNCPSRVRA